MNFDLPALPNEISLKDAVEFIVDNRGKTAPTAPKGIALIATNCVNNVDLYPLKLNLRYVSQETHNTWFRSHPAPGDILLTNKGSQNGAICLVPNPIDFCIAQDMVALRADPKKISPLYLFAALRSDLVQKRIKALNVDAVIPHLKKTDFNKLLIPLPDREVQESVGELYFELSSQIELLRETNATLEAIARALFKSWFVDFDPVRAKLEGRAPEGMDEATAQLFPNGFEESELGLVPKGWQVGTLGEHTSYLSRGISPKYIEDGGVIVINQKCIRDFSLDLSKARRHDPAQRKIDGRELLKGDILVNSTGVGTLGRVAQVLSLDNPAIVDSHVTVMRADSSLTWNYLGLSIMRRQAEIEGMGEGSTGQTELSRGKLATLKLLVPPVAVLQNFDDVVLPLRERFSANQTQAQTLATLRDTLLPRLISGQLRLPQAQTHLEETAA
ncbi:restriction endonuclease subunit S [Rhodoferax ferrireducens]|uniref:restriction endonuclease subunit S n=1 Tax=Rhodoferax ferrireducens TaxID=192843 RepID=UPI001300817A|nr:restriction endonuclease subunit S [Rhodoferax ferrireducens]